MTVCRDKTFEKNMLSAENGDPEAQFILGKCYYDGEIVEKDLEKAAYWWSQAAEQGFLEAKYQLGWCYFLGEGLDADLEKAFYWHKQAASDDPDMQFHLGFSYSQHDEEKGHYFLKLAADGGHPYALSELASSYEYGPDGIKNLKKAFSLYLAAAQNGSLRAQQHVAHAFENGHGVEKNLMEAAYWYFQASKNNDPLEASREKRWPELFTAEMRIKEQGEDLAKAIGIYMKAAEAGHAEAQFNLACFYKNGEGLAQSLEKACFWWAHAAKQNYPGAQEKLDKYCKKL